MLCGIKISPVTPTTDLSPVSWLNHSFFSVNQLNSTQGTAGKFFRGQVKEYVSHGNFQIDSLPIFGRYKGSSALYELVVVYLNNHGQNCHGHCTFNLFVSKKSMYL